VDFDDTPEEIAFRTEARAWLECHAERLSADAMKSPMGGHGPEYVANCRRWQRTLHDGGWAGITWPKGHGGRGGTGRQAGIFAKEQSAFDVSNGVFAVGVGMVGPTLMSHGTSEQVDRYLAPMLRGEEIWCQLFSEPGAGSDLAGLATRARRDGSEWVVDGQKVWTSGAQHSDFAILLARTDSDVPKHQGITFFIVDMQTPGIDVRPLRQITGVAHFNEVFLTGVRIPHSNIVGEVNAGWTVALTTMGHERALIGGIGGVGFDSVLQLARRMDRVDDPLVRQSLASVFTRMEILKYLGYRVQTAASQGRAPGPESSVMKLAYSMHLASLGDFGLELEGASGMLNDGSAIDEGEWQRQFLNQWTVRIGGGTDQIQRNIIGERVLGLPREPKPQSIR
jgi:alkylation response protein AidB-like acyl-CoA dehydrogenase